MTPRLISSSTVLSSNLSHTASKAISERTRDAAPAYIRGATSANGTVDAHRAAWQRLETAGTTAVFKWRGIPPGRLWIRPPALPDLPGMYAVSKCIWFASKELDGSLSMCSTVLPSRGPVLKVTPNSVPGQPPYLLLDDKPVARSSPIEHLQIAGALAEQLARSAKGSAL